MDAEYIILGRGVGYQIARMHDLAIAGYQWVDGIEEPRVFVNVQHAQQYLVEHIETGEFHPNDSPLVWITETRQ
jgi:hypothetical protein